MKNLTGKDKPFHSALDKAAALLKRKVGTGAEFMQELKGLGGIKEAEMADRKLAELGGMPKMTHEQFIGELGKRPLPAIDEMVLKNPSTDEVNAALEEQLRKNIIREYKDEGYTAKQIKEVLPESLEDALNSPFAKQAWMGHYEKLNKNPTHHDKYTLPGGENYREMLIKAPKGGEEFGGVGAHFGGRKNILASMRLKDRMTPEGKKLLHLEELQSDWHQQGREKGYKADYESQDEMMRKRDDLYDSRTALVKQALAIEKTGGTAPQELIDQIHGMNDQLRTIEERKDKARNAIPDAPFKKNWEEMALKRLVHHAAEKGYHGIVVTPGSEQADRYSLAKKVSRLEWKAKPGSDEGSLLGWDQNGENVVDKPIKASELSSYIGKDVANNLLGSPINHHKASGAEVRRIEGADLEIGGEGMKGFYDKKVPNILNAIGKKHGVKTQLGGHHIETHPAKSTPQIAAPGIGHFPEPITEPAQTKALHHFPITEDMRKDILTNGLPLYKEGGNVKATSTEDMKRELSDKYKPVATKASEALGKHEGKHLKVTQADRTKVGGGFLGGPGFSSLQHVDPAYEGAAWGVNSPSAASKIINANAQHPEGDVLWSAMIGAPNQHSSNQMVFDMLLQQFKAAIKAGKMTPELRALFNAKLEEAADNTGKPIFDKGTDIAGKNFFKNLNTFDRRRAAADLMGGNLIGGKKGQIFDYEKTMRETTEPELLDAPTHAIGPRLFGLTGQRSLQPNLHPAFPHILHGEDTGQMYHPVPRDIMLPDFHKQIQESKGRKVGFMDLTRNTPSQHLNEAFLTHLQKHGYAEGGQVQPTIPQMRQSLQANGKPFGDMSSIGAQEAPNMRVKSYVPPVAGQTGQMPVGGVDMSQGQAGQQLLPASMMQPNPQGQPQGQPAPAGAPSPMGAPPAPQAGGSNILQMTPQGQAMAAMQPQQGALPKMAVGGGISSLGSMINGNVSGPAPQQQMPFQSANAVPLPFVAKDGGSNNAPMNNNYSDNGATDFSVDNIQQMAKGGKVVSLEAMQKELKAMKHQVSKLKDNLDTMRLALTRNKKAK